MPILNWDKSLELGHEKIDGQHRKLVEIINRLHAILANGIGSGDIRPILMELYKYTMYHFSEEESLMSGIEPSVFSAHMSEHNDFIRKLDVLAERVKAGDLSTGAEVVTWLIGWLFEHISITDKKLTDYLLVVEQCHSQIAK